MMDQMRNEINRSLSFLKNEGVIIYPTDTIWGIGCDATNESVVDKIYRIKKRSESKSLIILVDSVEMLSAYVESIPDNLKTFLSSAEKPTTVIYNHNKGLASNVIASDNSVAVRIAGDTFCNRLIKEFGKPIVSTSANFSNQPSPGGFDEIDPLLLKQADYIVNLPPAEIEKSASQIIKINDLGEIEFLRK